MHRGEVGVLFVLDLEVHGITSAPKLDTKFPRYIHKTDLAAAHRYTRLFPSADSDIHSYLVGDVSPVNHKGLYQG